MGTEAEKVADDKPNPNVIKLVWTLADQFNIVFMSGREDRCREDTEFWLADNVTEGIMGYDLYMRTTGDHRPDYIIKGELFDQHIRGRYNVIGVLDDRNQVGQTLA
jgi:hypothetical protein